MTLSRVQTSTKTQQSFVTKSTPIQNQTHSCLTIIHTKLLVLNKRQVKREIWTKTCGGQVILNIIGYARHLPNSHPNPTLTLTQHDPDY